MNDELEKDLEDFKLLIEDPRWKTFCKVLQDNIDYLDQKIIAGDLEESELNKFRAQRKVYWQMKNTPEEMVRKLSSTDVEVDFDPYDKTELEVDKEDSA